MSGEFSLAGGGAEHVEDRLERFRTECHWRPQYTATRYVISCCKYTPLVNLCTTVKTRAPTTARTFRSESCERAFNCTDPPGTRTTSILGWSRVIVSKMFCSLTYHTGIWRVMLLEKNNHNFPAFFKHLAKKRQNTNTRLDIPFAIIEYECIVGCCHLTSTFPQTVRFLL